MTNGYVGPDVAVGRRAEAPHLVGGGRVTGPRGVGEYVMEKLAVRVALGPTICPLPM